MYSGKDFPKIETHQFLVLQAEIRTGIILDLKKKRRDEREERDWIVIFENLKDAETFAESRVNQFPEIECWIQSFDGQYKKRVFKEAS